MIEIFREKTEEMARDRAVKMLNEMFARYSSSKLLFLSSGGSSFELVNGIQAKHMGSNVTVGVTDERHSTDPAVNNFAQLMNTEFARRATEEGVQYIDTRVAGARLQEAAKLFESAIRNWKQEHAEGRVIITQGVGRNGHTCGMMPYPEDPQRFAELFESSEVWVRGYDAGDKNEFAERITITIPFLKEVVDCSVVYMVGKEKQDAFEALSQDGSIAARPSRVINHMKDVTLFTDL